MRNLIIIDEGSKHWYRGKAVHFPLMVNAKFVESVRELGLFDLLDLAAKPETKRTEFETVLLKAIHWLSSAQAQAENENVLLNLITCLETFLKPSKEDAIMATIAEGVAILTASGLEARKERKERIKYFYGKRSRLSHEGDGEILLSELHELTVIARELTLQMIRRRGEFKTQQELRDWIEDQKLGGLNPTN